MLFKNLHPLVECWLIRSGCGYDSAVLIIANHPIPAGIERFYYEIEIKKDIGGDVM